MRLMDDRPAYEAETHGVVVRVRPSYLAGQSEPSDNRWVWAYQVEVINLSGRPLTLLSRRWTITDALGRVEEVMGAGVVGEQPLIPPGESYTYTSGCPLQTSSGAMVGAYVMAEDDGRLFEVDIPAFSLDTPDVHRVLN
jgi:Uncharacterized protein affecting Mg2+/Co2+ transport